MVLGKRQTKFDWLTIIFYISLVAIGWVNIYSASLNDSAHGFFDMSQVYTKQLLFISLSFFLILFTLAIHPTF